MKLNRLAVLGSALAVCAFVATGAFADETKKAEVKKAEVKKEAAAVTMTGEVLDLYCYMNHPDTGAGAEHAKCANSCIAKGLPIGFLSDGVVYLIVGSEHNSAAEMVAGLAGKPSILTGKVMDHHGVKAIELESIKDAKS